MTFCKLETLVLYKEAACKSQGIVHVQRGASLRIVGKLFVYLKPICNVFPHQTEYFSEGVWVVSWREFKLGMGGKDLDMQNDS